MASISVNRVGSLLLPGLLLFCLCPGVRAQEEKENDIREELEEQKRLNRRLTERLESLEDSFRNLREEVREGAREEDAESEAREGLGDEVSTEILEELRGLEERLDLLPSLSGYYDFEYINDNRPNSPGTFRQHHLSLHIAKDIDSFHFFSEVEFEFGTSFEGRGGTDLEEARGEVGLEQAWLDYIWAEYLVLRGGLILTPGYWNINHYPNIVLSTRAPLAVSEVFRENFAGIMAHGSVFRQDLGFTYEAYVGNGDGEFFTGQDDDEGKAVGGRLTAHIPTAGLLYRFDVAIRGYYEDKHGQSPSKIWGVESQINRGPLELLFELAVRDAERDRLGLYAQPSYRFLERWAVFYRFDLLRLEGAGRTEEHTLGVNFRPIPDVSLKVEVFHSLQSKSSDFNGIATSIALAF